MDPVVCGTLAEAPMLMVDGTLDRTDERDTSRGSDFTVARQSFSALRSRYLDGPGVSGSQVRTFRR